MDPAKYEFQSEFAKRYLKEGRELGRDEGRLEGRAEGRAATLSKLLRLKFGDLPEAVVSRIQSATIDDLDRWSDRILGATSIQDTLS
jgi:predicted transposase YdaD